MKKTKKNHRCHPRNIYFPNWLKLRMDDSFINQVNWMIRYAENINADTARVRMLLKKHPWFVTLQVKRANPRDYGNN